MVLLRLWVQELFLDFPFDLAKEADNKVLPASPSKFHPSTDTGKCVNVVQTDP